VDSASKYKKLQVMIWIQCSKRIFLWTFHCPNSWATHSNPIHLS